MGLLGGASTVINATFTATDKASPQVKALRNNIKELGSKTGGPLGGLLSGLGSLNPTSLLAGGAIVGLAGGMLDAAKAAIEENVGIAQLNASLKANVPNWQAHTDEITKAVDAAENLAFSDDAARQSLALLLPTTHNVAEAVKLMGIAMNLSRLRGTDLAETTTLIGKVSQGNLSSLKRFGISLTGVSNATEALAKVQAISAGQSEAYANTEAGTLDKINIKWHDLVEDIGHGVLSLVDGIGGIGTAINGLHRALDPALAVTQDMEAAIRKQAAAMGLDADAAVAFYDAQVNATKIQQQNARATLDAAIIAEHAANATESYSDIATKLATNIDEVSYAVNVLGDGWVAAAGAVDDATGYTQAADGVLNQYAKTVRDTNQALEDQRSHYEDLNAVLPQVAHAFQPLRHVGNEFAFSLNKAAKAAAAFPTTIHDEIESGKGQVRAAMADIAWAMKHPFADDQYVAWLKKQIRKAEHEKLVAQKRGDVATVAEITKTIAAEQAIIDSIHGKTVSVNVDIYNQTRHPVLNGGRASGGPVSRGGTYLVGENGPEVLHMGAGGGAITQGRGGMGGGQTGDVYLDSIKVGRVLWRAIDAAQGRNWNTAGSSSTRN